MIELTQKETLTRALNYLLNLYDEFIAEIESKTRDILVHTSCKILLNDTYRQSADPKMFKKSLQEWRKTSFHLHQRRSELKAVKDRLFCQISDLKTAIDDMDKKPVLAPWMPYADEGFIYSVYSPGYRVEFAVC